MRQLYFLLFIPLIPACTTSSKEATGQDRNAQLITQYFAAFNDHDWRRMASFYQEKAEFKDPSLGPGVVTQTREQTVKKYTQLQQAFPDIRDRVVQIYPSGDQHVAVEFISSGTAPDGSTFELPVCTIFTIEDGQITRDFTYYDNFEE